METKWNSDLASLLRAHIPSTCAITCRGVDSLFGVYQHALITHFAQNPVVWKRNGKVFQSRLAFPLKFVSFDEELCWSPNFSPAELTKAAYLHAFFINAASVDEYRTSVRHNVSEWFAKVSSKPDVQWLIVIDSTRAKEKKNRSALMEKLKSDFSKHQNRLIEVSESIEHGSFSGLVQGVQTALLSHLDILTNAWETHLSSTRDLFMENDWDIAQYFTSVTDYARLYWSFGALEHALTIYDDLDRYLVQVFLDLANIDDAGHPKWLSQLRSGSMSVCPTIGEAMLQSSYDQKRNNSFLGMRHFLVSQQILLSLYLYQARLRSRGAPPSLRVDFAGLIVKYAQHCQQTVVEHSSVLKLQTFSPLHLACWTVFVVGEALHIAGLLADPTSIEGCIPAVCQLYMERFRAVLSLSVVFTPEGKKVQSELVTWLQNSGLTDDNLLIEVIRNEHVYATHLQKVHDSASAFLTQCGRHRMAAHIGGEYAQWLRSNGRADAALPYDLRAVGRMLADGCCSQTAVDRVKGLIPLLDGKEDYQRLLAFRMFVSMHDTSKMEREQFTAQWLANLKERPNMKLSLRDLQPAIKSPFLVKIGQYSTNVQLPNGKIVFELFVTSRLLVPVSNYRLIVRLRELDAGVMSRRKEPVFEMNYSSRDGACRILSPHRGHAFDRPVPASPSSVVLELTAERERLEGENRVIINEAATLRGCYVLESVELSICDGALSIDCGDGGGAKPVVIFVQSTPNKLWVQNEKADFLAGVVQFLEVSLEAGAALEQSQIAVKPSIENRNMEFKNESVGWSPNFTATVPALKLGEKFSLRIPFCLLMDDKMTVSENPSLIELAFEWVSRVWKVQLSFTSLLEMKSKTTLLENRILFEVDISHSRAPDWTVALETATLEIPNSNEAPPTLAKLLNAELGDLVPNIVSSLVWTLPVTSEEPLKHRMRLQYLVKEGNENAPVTLIDRKYTYESDLELRVPKVGYELCTQVLSQQPGAQLCRIGSPCDLVVSLRSLKSGVEMLYVVLEADSRLWMLNDNAKVLQVKESGLGQMAFSVVPCAAGFLPYPSVSIYSCVTVGSRTSIGDGTWSEGAELVPGSPLVSFLRTAGKQIRVLGPSQLERSEERKSGFKQKLVQLFD